MPIHIISVSVAKGGPLGEVKDPIGRAEREAAYFEPCVGVCVCVCVCVSGPPRVQSLARSPLPDFLAFSADGGAQSGPLPQIDELQPAAQVAR